jgi:hypothetical protein
MLLLLNRKRFNPRNLPNLQLWLPADRIGVQGYSLDFDGTDDSVQANNVITAYPFTFEAWVRPDVVNANQTLISINNNTSATIFYSLNITNSAKANIRIENGGTLVDVSSTASISANTWVHLAAVFASATDRKIYINGVQDGSNTSSINFNNTVNNQVLLGVIRTTIPTFYLNGKMSDVRIWNTARTTAQISANYQKRLIGNESGLVGYWKLDKGSGTTVADSTTNANAGTITGAVWDNSEPFTEPIDDGTAVRIWSDQSGNGYDATQSTTAARPTYIASGLNGLPVVRFDGTDDNLALSGGALGMLRNVAGATVFLVVKYPANSTAMFPFAIRTNATTPRIQMLQSSANKFQTAGRRLDADTTITLTSTQSVTTNAVIQTAFADYQNTILRQFINGTIDGENLSFQTSGNTSDTDSNAISIGATAVPSFPLNGDIAEIIVYNRALNTSELSQVHRYLSRKWGIQLA